MNTNTRTTVLFVLFVIENLKEKALLFFLTNVLNKNCTFT